MADPGELAKSLLQKNFPKFGSFRRYVTYVVKNKDGYNAGTGVVTPNPGGSHPLWMIFLSYGSTITQSAEMENDDQVILSVDRKAVFPSADLPVIPKKGDQIQDGAVLWRVMGINDDPKPAHYALHCRPLVQT